MEYPDDYLLFKLEQRWYENRKMKQSGGENMCYQPEEKVKHDDWLYMALLLLLALILLLVGACNGVKPTPTKPVDVAAETGKQISKAFLLAYDSAAQLTKYGTPEQQEYAITYINPLINKAKIIIPEFNRAVAAWQRTGNAGDNIVLKQKEMEVLYDQIQKLIIEAFAKK